MTLTRRRFHVQLAQTTLAGPAWVAMACSSPPKSHEATTGRAGGETPHGCNFQASYMTWDLPPRPDPRPNARHNIPLGNKARIQLEALLDVIDERTGEKEQFVLIAPCRTEWVYAERGLFQIPSREYRNIYSLEEQRSMSRSIAYDGEETRATPVTEVFRSVEIDVVRFASSRWLDSPAAINAATEKNYPLVGRTKLREPERGKRYVLEYPIKTMNFRPENSSFQVDTGPILVPDFSSGEERPMNRLEMAHVAFNRLDRAEFILRRPTPLRAEDGREGAKVLHYSEVREHEVSTTILAAEAV